SATSWGGYRSRRRSARESHRLHGSERRGQRRRGSPVYRARPQQHLPRPPRQGKPDQMSPTRASAPQAVCLDCTVVVVDPSTSEIRPQRGVYVRPHRAQISVNAHRCEECPGCRDQLNVSEEPHPFYVIHLLEMTVGSLSSRDSAVSCSSVSSTKAGVARSTASPFVSSGATKSARTASTKREICRSRGTSNSPTVRGGSTFLSSTASMHRIRLS